MFCTFSVWRYAWCSVCWFLHKEDQPIYSGCCSSGFSWNPPDVGSTVHKCAIPGRRHGDRLFLWRSFRQQWVHFFINLFLTLPTWKTQHSGQVQGSFGVSVFVAGNMQIIRTWGSEHESWLQAIHSVLGVGSLVGPLVAAPFLSPVLEVFSWFQSTCYNVAIVRSTFGWAIQIFCHFLTKRVPVVLLEKAQHNWCNHLTISLFFRRRSTEIRLRTSQPMPRHWVPQNQRLKCNTRISLPGPCFC